MARKEVEREAQTPEQIFRELYLEKHPVEYIEEYFKIVTKQGELLPMKLRPCQRHYIENRSCRDVILKGRQMGITTGVMAGNSQIIFTKHHRNMTIITHEDQLSQFLLLGFDRFYNNLPERMREENLPKWKSASRKYYPEMDCYIYVDSAKSDNIGIGHTLHIVHLSEVSKWSQKKAQSLYTGISQTVPRDALMTIESTPQGRVGIFYELYEAAKKGDIDYKSFFYPWWWDSEYSIRNCELKTNQKTEYAASRLNMSLERFLAQEKQMMEVFGLSPGQIGWRREKIAELGELFFQEYPENDSECWLSNEQSIVDGVFLKPYYGKVQQGREEGNVTIWKDVVGGHNYVIGADTASGSARDYSVASVLDARNMEYVARLRGKIHTDLFAEQVYQLGVRYNNALLGVERIGHGHSVLRVLLEKNYPNLYYHTDYDDVTFQNVTDVGWKTSVKTKPLMINAMITAFRSGDLISYSENLLREASSLSWEGGVDTKVQTASGSNDDEFMAVAISLQLREQIPLMSSEQRDFVFSYR